jgi:hypothetical protein
LNQSSEFYDCCRKNDIIIGITKYPINLNFSKIEKMLNEFGVKMYYFFDNGIDKTFRRIPLDMNGMQDNRYNFKHCGLSNACNCLEDGKIYPCAKIAYIKYFNKYFNKNLLITENDYIDIYKVNNITEILDYLCRPMPFCRYCHAKKAVFGQEYAISKKDISEWI